MLVSIYLYKSRFIFKWTNTFFAYFFKQLPLLEETLNLSKIFSKGQNLVNEDCNKLNPTNTASQSHWMLTLNAIVTLINTKVPATARTIFSRITILLIIEK
jgi:hypothetical protein